MFGWVRSPFNNSIKKFIYTSVCTCNTHSGGAPMINRETNELWQRFYPGATRDSTQPHARKWHLDRSHRTPVRWLRYLRGNWNKWFLTWIFIAQGCYDSDMCDGSHDDGYWGYSICYLVPGIFFAPVVLFLVGVFVVLSYTISWHLIFLPRLISRLYLWFFSPSVTTWFVSLGWRIRTDTECTADGVVG